MHLRAALTIALSVTLSSVYARAADTVHIVGKGQTLGRIAKRYRVSVEAIREANGLRVGEHIHPGLELVIPSRTKDGATAGATKTAAVTKRGKPEKGQERADRGRHGAKTKAKADDDAPEPAFRGPRKRGFVRLVRGSEKLELQMLTRHGRLAPNALAGLSQMLHSSSGAKLAIDPRLAALIGRVSDHFNGRTIHVVSGFRPYTPAQYTLHSNHNLGRAMDFSIEGIPNTVLRDYCRTFRDAGVGYYPNSTFVHLDVRTGKAYWIDYARAGEAPRYGSPTDSKAADEATRDVEPHLGAGDPDDAADGSP